MSFEMIREYFEQGPFGDPAEIIKIDVEDGGLVIYTQDADQREVDIATKHRICTEEVELPQ
jgi:hypothetical protein